MVRRSVAAALAHLRERNVRTLCRKLVERASGSLGTEIREVESTRAPAWLPDADVTTYAVGQTAYVNAVGDADAAVPVDAEGVEALEVPIAFPEHCESVTVAAGAGQRSVTIDDSYAYPSQLWTTVSVPASADRVELRVSTTGRSPDRGLLGRLPERDVVDRRTRLGLPAVRPEARRPPIVLISIDSLPYTERAHVEPILDALGPDAVVPSEPRTQGHWTPPSHASMFTGTHPGDHGYVGHGLGDGDERPIRPDLVTIPQLLTDRGYKCSGLASHTRILPEFGFGRGFHRFASDAMAYDDWLTREHDARASVDRLLAWLDDDRQTRDHGLYYFLHVFDPHFPYLPPLSRVADGDLDLSAPTRYREQVDAARGDPPDYVDRYEHDHDVDPDLAAEMQRFFQRSVEYTAEQVARLLDALDRFDLLADALVIVTGDHGEEFGERGFFTHASLYDRNVRPFVAIKPPADAGWSVPETVDTVDFLPTIAREVGADVPDQCAGEPLQDRDGPAEPRVTERITPRRYSVAVESGGVKGIFTYGSGYPDRPPAEVVEDGPVLTEFYDLAAVRDGDDSELEDPPEASTLERIAAEFATAGAGSAYESPASAAQPAQETRERLRDLGYR